MILVIDRSRRDAKSLAEMFYIMGILSRGVTPSEALSEISLEYKLAIITEPSRLPDKESYLEKLKSYAKIPVIALTDNPDARDEKLFDLIIRKSSLIIIIKEL